MDKLNIIIPMAGEGSRFKGFSETIKPLIPCPWGKLFELGIKSFIKSISIPFDITFVIRASNEEISLESTIQSSFPEANIIVLNELTSGALETLYIASLECSNGGIISLDCDLFFKDDAFTNFINNKPMTPALTTFSSEKPIYSYVNSKDGKAIKVREKEVISNQAIIGAYFFNDINSFQIYAKEELEIKNKGEKYISPLFDKYISRGKDVFVFKSDYHLSYGTPDELEIAKKTFLENSSIFNL